ncbi:hypothetical protein LPB87_19850 [Flavobacterium sp. EDS]|uniref:hypothetical protein n=1 Tax=Flavobacterium sp. EDS TaxID=2897328 RepID=UPI001E429C00|nr:hypothetical protein [Flavobacterium sp. EDS]MCD0476653.1 hypothetical protein [Flavobacterium sp. EDS]
MKKRKKNKSLTTKEKIIFWVKKPENIALIFLLIIVTIIGIIDDKLDIILIVYVVAFLFGLLIGTIFYLKDKFF